MSSEADAPNFGCGQCEARIERIIAFVTKVFRLHATAKKMESQIGGAGIFGIGLKERHRRSHASPTDSRNNRPAHLDQPYIHRR
jgi:hypothetical protein